jgi:hypothetical protein
MYIETIPNQNSPPAILLRESYREDGQVKKRTLANISHWPSGLVEQFKKLLRGGVVVDSAEAVFSIERSLPQGHVQAVRSAMKRLEMAFLLGRRASRERDLVLAMIAARIVAPSSKLSTSRAWHTTTLAWTLAWRRRMRTISTRRWAGCWRVRRRSRRSFLRVI